jgi:hypothetical protein
MLPKVMRAGKQKDALNSYARAFKYALQVIA